MSDNVHSLPVLGDAEIFAVKHLPFDAIPQFNKRGDDGLESSSIAMSEKAFDVLQDEMPGAFDPQHPGEVKEQRPPAVLESSPLAGEWEWLAGKAADQHIEVRQGIGLDCCRVPEGAVIGKSVSIDLDCMLVDFRKTSTSESVWERVSALAMLSLLISSSLKFLFLVRSAADTEFEAADAAKRRKVRSDLLHVMGRPLLRGRPIRIPFHRCNRSRSADCRSSVLEAPPCAGITFYFRAAAGFRRAGSWGGKI
jgi:hypothetical protein